MAHWASSGQNRMHEAAFFSRTFHVRLKSATVELVSDARTSLKSGNHPAVTRCKFPDGQDGESRARPHGLSQARDHGCVLSRGINDWEELGSPQGADAPFSC